ncbi:heme oxygenase 1 isoform 2 [Thraustotheca clavata]|uniref:heme oxygenase (biliverdin-producing) n=1 Tax=Thraustotheca clavata TaxID=74557 RepID=A0A1V9ZPR8_9STRA|nr:heme oxygenase 1 isoform 2 [Thraustotheca clavata]
MAMEIMEKQEENAPTLQEPAEENNPLASQMTDLFKLIHEVSLTKRQEVDPSLVTRCPKGVTQQNRPIGDELELRTWGLFEEESVKKPAPQPQPEPEHTVNLAKDLKYGTKKSHREAENVHFIREFLKGRVNRDAFKCMLAMYYYIYTEMEEMMRQAYEKKDPIYSPLHFPEELNRVPAICEDLAYYFGPNWKKAIPPPTRATKEYLARLHYIGTHEPAILVAHAYTRYLGDLSGGQVLKRIAIKSMGLINGEGIAFYEFPKMKVKHKVFKDKYRQTLDSLNVSQEVSDRLVEEANLAFLLNMKVFEELDIISGYSTLETQQAEALLRRREAQALATSEQKSACPFAKLIGQPGIRELAMKYHGDDMSTEEFATLKAEYEEIKAATRRRLFVQYGCTLLAVASAVGVSALLRKR